MHCWVSQTPEANTSIAIKRLRFGVRTAMVQVQMVLGDAAKPHSAGNSARDADAGRSQQSTAELKLQGQSLRWRRIDLGSKTRRRLGKFCIAGG